jgi:PHD/YefM family antitoxin component YafN of YafNO toxin-antitoxin module
MKTVELRKASKSLAHYTAELDSGSLVITSDEEPVAALVSVRGMDRESLALSLSSDFAEIIRRARSQAKRGRVLSLRQVKEALLESPAAAVPARRSRAKSQRPRMTRKKH